MSMVCKLDLRDANSRGHIAEAATHINYFHDMNPLKRQKIVALMHPASIILYEYSEKLEGSCIKHTKGGDTQRQFPPRSISHPPI